MIAAERDCFAKIEYTRSALEAVTEWAQYVYRRNLKVYGMFALAVGCWDHPRSGGAQFHPKLTLTLHTIVWRKFKLFVSH